MALYFWFGGIGGLGNGFGYATPIPVMAKWFPDKRGLAVGLAVGGYGAGSAIFGKLSLNYLIPAYGWRSTFEILGGIFLVMTLIRRIPAEEPAGWLQARGLVASAGNRQSSRDHLRVHVRRRPCALLPSTLCG